MSENSNEYQLLLSSSCRYDKFADSCHERKFLTECNITPDQLKNLKLLVCSVLRNRKGEVKDAEDVTTIYELLKLHYACDVTQAMPVLCLMLETAGVNLKKFKHLPKLQGKSPILLDPDFQWRKKLVHYSERAKKQKKVSMVIDHYCTKVMVISYLKGRVAHA